MKQAGQFSNLMDVIQGKKIGIVPHTHADLDAITSAISLSIFLKSKDVCDRDVLLQDFPNKEATKFIEFSKASQQIDTNINILYFDDIQEDNYDGFLVVDTNSYELVPRLKGKKVFGVIDHHNPVSFDIETNIYIYDSSAPAVAELITQIFSEFDPLPEKQLKLVSMALAMGIISDTARFKSGRPETFEILAELIRKSGKTYEELRIIMHTKRDEMSKIAILSSLKRLDYRVINEYIVVVSEADNSEAEVASMLTDGIADVAFVVRWVNGEKKTRISARADVNFPIPLNEVLTTIAGRLGGKGGGHKKAAGAGVPVHSDQTIQACIDVLADKIAELGSSNRVS